MTHSHGVTTRPMPVLKLLGGLRRFGGGEQHVSGETVRDVLDRLPVPAKVLFADGGLNRDIEVLVNGRNISFLAGLDTALAPNDQVTLFLHGARGYPGG